jgi:hypothetical protein
MPKGLLPVLYKAELQGDAPIFIWMPLNQNGCLMGPYHLTDGQS